MQPIRALPARSATAAAAALLLAFGPAAWSLPQGAQVIHGQVGLSQPAAGQLQINASNGAIINWQQFNVGAGELTRFVQPSASSAVLNRVTGAGASQLLGQIQGNGRVFLINPSGIVVGAGARIDTNSFIASTLDIADADFLAGRLRFLAGATAGSVRNSGIISAGPGGRVALIAPDIENSGIIQAPGGQILLAAGRRLELASMDLEGVTFEVQAPTDSVLNLGQLLADNGAVQVFAGTLRHSGEIRANRLVQDADGSIRLVGSHEVTLTSDSVTRADGLAGGSITIRTTRGDTRVEGQVSATGSGGQGGQIHLLGERVAVGQAVVDASGSSGGGAILVGGDYQGANPAVQNASRVAVGADAVLRADATVQGDGGRVIVWADQNTRFAGHLSVRGGPEGGDGGFAEVSGKEQLAFSGTADLTAPAGRAGSLLLDPLDIVVAATGGVLESALDEFADFASNIVTISPAAMAAVGGTVVLQAARDIYFNDAVTLSTPGAGLTVMAGGASATGGQIYLDHGIVTTGGVVTMRGTTLTGAGTISTNGGAVDLQFTSSLNYNALVSSGGGAVTVSTPNSSINSLQVQAGAGAISVSGRNGVLNSTIGGTGAVAVTSSNGGLNNNGVTGGTVTLQAASSISNVSVNASDRVDATSTNSSISLNNRNSQPLRLGTVTAASSLSLSSDAGFVQAAGGLLTSPYVSLYGYQSGATFGSVAAPLSIASPRLSLSGMGAAAHVAFSGSPTLTQLAFEGTVAAIGASTVSGAANLSALSLGAAGGVLQVSATSSGGLGSGFSISTNDGGIHATTLDLPGAAVSLSAEGPVTLGTMTGASLDINAQGAVTITSATTSGGGGIEVNTGSCSSGYSVCTGVSPITAGSLVTTGGGSVTLRTYDSGNVDVTTITSSGSVSVQAGTQYTNYAEYVGYPNGYKEYVTTNQVTLGTVTAQGSVSLYNQGDGNLTIAQNLVATNGSVYLSAGASYNDDGRYDTPDRLTTTIVSTAGLQAGSNLNVYNNGDGAITVSGAVAAGSYTQLQTNHGNLTVTGPMTSAYSISLYSGGGALSVGQVSATNPGFGDVDLSADLGIQFEKVSAAGGSVTMTASAGSIRGTLDDTAADISALRSVNLSAQDSAGGFIGNASFANPLDIVAGTAATDEVVLHAGGAIGALGKPITVSDTGVLDIDTAQGRFFVQAQDFSTLRVRASAAGLGAGGTSSVTSTNLTPINATSDGSTITIGDVQQSAGTLHAFRFEVTDGALVLGDVALTTATGYNQLFLQASGGIQQLAGDMLVGSADIRAGSGATTLGNITVAAGTGNALYLSGDAITTGDLLAPSLEVQGSDLTLGSVTTTGTNRGFGQAGYTCIARLGTCLYPLDDLSLSASGQITTTGNISSATSAIVSAGTGIDVDGGAGTLTGGHYTNTYYYTDTVNAAAGSGTLRAASVSAHDVTVSGDTLTTGAITADRNLNVSGGTLTTGNLSAGSNLQVSGTTFTTGDITSGGGLSIDASGAYVPGSIALSGSSVTIQAPDGIDLVSGDATLTSANVTLRAINGDVQANLANATNLTLQAGGHFAVHSGAALTVVDITADSLVAGSIDGSSVSSSGQMIEVLSSGTTATLTAASAATNLDLRYREASGDLTALDLSTSGSFGNGGGRIYLTAQSAAVTGSSLTMNGSSLEIYTEGDIALNALTNAAGGAVTLVSYNGGVDIGTVALTGGALSASAGGSGADITVTRLTTLGGGVSLSADSGSILKAGSQPAQIDTADGQGNPAATVSLSAPQGSIGTAGNALQLANVVTLNLDARDAIEVDVAGTLTNLSLAAYGSGLGNLQVTNSNFAGLSVTRVGGDLLLGALAPVSSGNFGLTARDGNLIVTGDITNVAALTLDAGYSEGSAADLRLQAQGADLNITASGAMVLRAGRDVLVQADAAHAVAVQGGLSTVWAGRDVVVTAGAGAAASALLQGTYTDVRADRDVLVQAGGASALLNQSTTYSTQIVNAGGSIQVLGGSAGVTGATAGITSATGQQLQAGGNLLVQAGTADGASASVVSAGNQYVYAQDFSVLGGGDNAVASVRGNYQDFQQIRGNVRVEGGSGAAAAAEVVSTGSQQYIGTQYTYYYNATDSVLVQGGSGAGATATIRSASSQEVHAAVQGGTGDIQVIAGTGAGADASIVSQGGSQTIGSTSTYLYSPTNNVLVQASGTGTARIQAAGSQQVYGSGDISVLGGAGAAMTASIETTAGSQTIGTSDVAYYNDPTQNILVQGGAGGAAWIRASGSQTLRAGGNLSVLGGTGANTTASIQSTGSSQNIGYTYIFSNDPLDNITVQGGTGADAAAWIKAASSQTLDAGNAITVAAGGAGAYAEIVSLAGSQSIGNRNFSSYDQTGVISLTGGTGNNAWAKISAGGSQTLANAGNISLAGGAGDASGALVLATSGQTFNSGGALTLTGGSGSAPGLNETAVRNSTSGTQSISMSGAITVTGGGSGSDTWIRQSGSGAQNITTGGALRLEALVANTGTVSIESGTGTQTVNVTDVIALDNQAGGRVALRSGGAQNINADSMTIALASPNGTSPYAGVSAVGSQIIRMVGGAAPASLTLTNTSGISGSLVEVMTAGNQTLSLYGARYTNAGMLQIGSAAGLGAAKVEAGGSQTIIAGGIQIQGGLTSAARASLLAVGDMVLSTLDGPLQVLGGAAGAAEIDPPVLSAVSNGSILIDGGAASTATATVVAGLIDMTATNGNMAVIGGGAPATVTSGSTFALQASGNLTIAPNAGGAAINAPGGLNIALRGNCFGCTVNALIGTPLTITEGPPIVDILSDQLVNGLISTILADAYGIGDLYLTPDGVLVYDSRRRSLAQCF